jgi:hypothetical protein
MEKCFASSEDDLREAGGSEKQLRQNLNNGVVVQKISTKCRESKAIYFDLQNREGNMLFIDAINIAETLLVAIATLNGTYIRKGFNELKTSLIDCS